LNLASGSHEQADILRNLGIIQYKTGNFEKALEFFEQSLQKQYRLPVLRLVRDTYLKLYASSRIKNDHRGEKEYSIIYRQLKDSVEQMLNSRVLSPDSFTMELKEKEFVEQLVHQEKALFQTMSLNTLEYNQKLTEAELERLKTEEALARMNQEKMLDEIDDQELNERLASLEKEHALQQLSLSQQELKEERQKQIIYMLLGGVLIVSIILFLMYNRYRLKKKSHAALDHAYDELSIAHQKLKDTQDQLIRTEKMASLGQMTAGIAHEIQNPLNFVLNFSESSVEILDEIKSAPEAEKNKGIEELKINLQKIAEHGRRADGIVKNMLQHSRVSKNEKTSTDLNKLAEEYMQLAFHGIRAKDNTFSCHLEKHLDAGMPSLKVIPQDISRVFLNLFNNAFYAVNEKSVSASPDYKPVVRLNTKVNSGKAIITIEDNGKGIPVSIKEKIFEPFFTTKPTGQGTGLGLSLSYDILKNHGGDLQVQSEEGKGTAFSVVLPLG
jgi:two-component system, NtrC family, sensor kinase